uniref:Secreted protein n=1 Tax=Romanomermis culicivorax TaxID=13658 RepID=A0A915K2L4_ROMCU
MHLKNIAVVIACFCNMSPDRPAATICSVSLFIGSRCRRILSANLTVAIVNGISVIRPTTTPKLPVVCCKNDKPNRTKPAGVQQFICETINDSSMAAADAV